MPRSLAFALAALITLPNYAESCGRIVANRHRATCKTGLQVAVVKQSLTTQCDCQKNGGTCKCLNCCCDSRRPVVQAAVNCLCGMTVEF